MNSQQNVHERLDRLVPQQMQAAGTPGLALALTDRDHLLHVAAYGLSEVAAGRPVVPGDLFEIGSITKSFTAMALLQLQEAGRIDLHAPVQRYLPWFYVPAASPLTLHHLLTHTAGLIMGTEFSTEARYEVWALRHTESTAPPGTWFHYSNVGYKVLGLVLEELLGRNCGEILRERILSPLGMAASEPVITHDVRLRMALGHEPLYDDRPFHRSLPLAPATWFETATADGSIASTAADMAAYLRLLLNRGRGPGGRILSEESFRLLTGRHIPLPDEEFGGGAFYGYGLQVGGEEGQGIVCHSGGMVGYYAAILADLDDGLGVAVLCNGPSNPEAVAAFALQLLRAARHGDDLPAPPEPLGLDPGRVANGSDYAGLYQGGARTFGVEPREGGLILRGEGQEMALEQRGRDCFYVSQPALSRFLLRFGRRDGQVVEALHGPDVYLRQGQAPAYGMRGQGNAAAADQPGEWAAYPGHYRCHNPWLTNFRVILRRGRLSLVEPSGAETELVPLAEGLFRAGEDERSPERLRFDTILGGQALRANLSGCDYYRTFTP